jgi:hypothetical protein
MSMEDLATDVDLNVTKGGGVPLLDEARMVRFAAPKFDHADERRLAGDARVGRGGVQRSDAPPRRILEPRCARACGTVLLHRRNSVLAWSLIYAAPQAP